MGIRFWEAAHSPGGQRQRALKSGDASSSETGCESASEHGHTGLTWTHKGYVVVHLVCACIINVQF